MSESPYIPVMQSEFRRIMAEHAALAEQRRPAREAYDALAVQINALVELQKAQVEIFKPIEMQMSDLSNEAAKIVRFLDGKTGELVVE